MIPPCDPSILEHNPKFKRLYENLINNFLNPDGSTRASTDPAREAVVEDLKQCQIKRAKKRIKERTLRQLAFASDSDLRDECHDNLAIISIYLDTPRAAIEPDTPAQEPQDVKQGQGKDDALSLLSHDFETFYSHIPSFILQFSHILSSAISDLRTIAAITTDDSVVVEPELEPKPSRTRTIPALSRSSSNHYSRARARDRRVRTSMAPVPPLSTVLRERVRALRSIQLSDLPSARRQMAATAAEVLSVQAQVMERTVILLERVKHGALARATKARAEHLAVVAQGVEGKLEVTKLEIAATLYTPETSFALGRYQQHLRETRARLDERREIAIEELSRYGNVEGAASESGSIDRSSTFTETARRYGVLAKEVEGVKMEIARLGE
ncbi:uncharacterized protein N7503_001788 [Penicillium pulvis]|uniref:uncharacterized protein n=1 Tax=Penicillium pulvis TaxID=1562058 RepID=UPI002546A3B9|nr:uncharacterized protein N7503_001788 [Penicillium pulvis]KAJ5809570.1 hypothetical protein N7503_001788 [Penicillium pulvis]